MLLLVPGTVGWYQKKSHFQLVASFPTNRKFGFCVLHLVSPIVNVMHTVTHILGMF